MGRQQHFPPTVRIDTIRWEWSSLEITESDSRSSLLNPSSNEKIQQKINVYTGKRVYTYRILLGGANSRQNHEKNPLNWCTAEKIKFRLNSTNSSLKYTPDKWGAKWGDREREKVDPCGSSCSVVYSLVQIVNWVYLKKKKNYERNKKNWIYILFFFLFFFCGGVGNFVLDLRRLAQSASSVQATASRGETVGGPYGGQGRWGHHGPCFPLQSSGHWIVERRINAFLVVVV